MRFLILLLLVNTAHSTEHRTQIAVIDSGVDLETSKQKYMCEDGNVVLDPKSTGYDTDGHGSNIASAIGENIDEKNYCVVSYQVLNSDGTSQSIFVKRLEKVKKDIFKRKVRFVNMSIQGEGSNLKEFLIIKEIASKGVIISIAAGNHAKDLDKSCDEFPACYNRNINSRNIHVVGSYDKRYSNYGRVVRYLEIGTWKTKSGTSQACAIHTSKVVNGNYDIVR